MERPLNNPHPPSSSRSRATDTAAARLTPTHRRLVPRRNTRILPAPRLPHRPPRNTRLLDTWEPRQHPSHGRNLKSAAPFPRKIMDARKLAICITFECGSRMRRRRLSPETLHWLDSQLQQTGDRPVIIALHHHPLPIDSEIMDGMMLHNADEFLAIVDQYPQIKIVLCRSIHQEFHQQRSGVSYLGTPSTCLQLLPKSHPIIVDEIPPGFRLLELAIDGTWNTRVERVAAQSPPD